MLIQDSREIYMYTILYNFYRLFKCLDMVVVPVFFMVFFIYKFW